MKAKELARRISMVTAWEVNHVRTCGMREIERSAGIGSGYLKRA